MTNLSRFKPDNRLSIAKWAAEERARRDAETPPRPPAPPRQRLTKRSAPTDVDLYAESFAVPPAPPRPRPPVTPPPAKPPQPVPASLFTEPRNIEDVFRQLFPRRPKTKVECDLQAIGYSFGPSKRTATVFTWPVIIVATIIAFGIFQPAGLIVLIIGMILRYIERQDDGIV